MEISRKIFCRWLGFVLLPTLACTGDAAGPDLGSGASSSTGAPLEPTGDGPPDSGDSSGGDPPTTTTGDPGGTTDFADPGPVCGDGIPSGDEECDAGADNGPYGWCTETCALNVCGDGKVLVGTEGCDQGELNDDEGYCKSDCQLGVCGDGKLFFGVEECDAGAAASDVYGECDASCTVNRCGDGTLDPGFEECDAGADNGLDPRGEAGMAGCDLECGLAGRRVFLSSQLFTGDLGTRVGADLACQNMAKAAGFKHFERFKALLADAEVDPFDFVLADPAGRPFMLPSGLVLAADVAALVKDGPGDGITLTETGQTLHGLKVWTNLNVAGTAYLKDPASTCAGWSSADPDDAARIGLNAPPPGDAAALATWKAKKQWLSYATWTCKDPYRIYCIEAS